MPPRALLATDLSDGSLAAARVLPHVAEPGAEVFVAHVVPSPSIVGRLPPDARASMERALEEGAGGLEKDVRAWAERAGLAPAGVRILRGDVSRALAAEAEALGATVVAVGSTGAGALERLVLGSSARATLRRVSGRAVLVARGDLAQPPRRILLGTDFGPTSAPAAARALALAARHDAELIVAHVVDPAGWHLAYDPRGMAVPLVPEAVMRRTVEDLMSTFRSEHLGGGGRPLVLHGRPAVELASAAAAEDADLVVVGSHGPGVLERALLGSVAEAVVERAAASVLVVPA